MVFSCTDGNIQAAREACTVLRVEVINFSWCSCGLSFIERNLKKWILSMKSSCIDYGVLQKIFQKIHVVKSRQPESSIMEI